MKCQPSPPPNPQGPLWVRGRRRLTFQTGKVPTFVTAHTFCGSRDTQVSYGWCLLIQGYIFSCFQTMRRKQNLARALGVQKENWG